MDNYKSTFETWNKIAKLYESNFMDLDIYNDSYDIFCEAINKSDATIFEIACGPGNITKYLLTKNPTYKIDASDIAPNMLKIAKENNPTANFSVMDCREIDKVQKKYDAIVCGFCMPYLSKEDSKKFIHDCAKLLNNNGILYFSTIEGDYKKSDFEISSNGEHKMFVYYHQDDYLQEWLNENNFEIIQVLRKNYTKSNGNSSVHLIFIAKKK